MRLPRILTALICGAGLAAAGAAFQALFSNPLATADTLGVSTGAAFGAVLGILLGLDAFGVQTLSLGVGLVAVFGVWRLSLRQGRSSILLLILSGLVVSALFSSLISLVKFAADPQDELPAVTFWLMGSLTGADWKSLKLGLPFIVIGSLAIWACDGNSMRFRFPKTKPKVWACPLRVCDFSSSRQPRPSPPHA